MLHTALRLCVALALMATAAGAQPTTSRLVGTWRVEEFCNVDSPGDTTYSLGRNPVGLFMYDPSGKLMIQAMRTPRSAAFSKDSLPLLGMAEVRESYFGYFGTYTITSDTTVIHHVVGGTIPSYVGTDQHRGYRIRGDTLSIGGESVPPGCRRLIKVR